MLTCARVDRLPVGLLTPANCSSACGLLEPDWFTLGLIRISHCALLLLPQGAFTFPVQNDVALLRFNRSKLMVIGQFSGGRPDQILFFHLTSCVVQRFDTVCGSFYKLEGVFQVTSLNRKAKSPEA